MAIIAICECVHFDARRIMEDSFNSFPMSLAQVFEKLGKGQDGKSDVRSGGDCSIHETANSLMVGNFLHVCCFGGV
jgi:hypothetical protein